MLKILSTHDELYNFEDYAIHQICTLVFNAQRQPRSNDVINRFSGLQTITAAVSLAPRHTNSEALFEGEPITARVACDKITGLQHPG